ncbi:hypothetical protein [Nocardioides psychrotolerans]|uniref:hypothetical protein n=1 Tax=Nocardioides psychrotolerans TaxID=1005945 RepID=UPI0031381DD8
MKRLLGLVLLLVLLMPGAGPVAAAAPAMRGACGAADPLPCEPAEMHLDGVRRLTAPTRPLVTVVVRTFTGDPDITGRITLSFKRKGGGFSWTRTFGYPGGEKRYRGPRLTKTGTYVVRARYLPPPDSPHGGATRGYVTEVRR